MTVSKTNLIAHFREIDINHKDPQILWDHLTNVSKLTGQFSNKIGLKEVGEIIGLLHDLGKGSQQFQNYILSAEGLINPDADQYIDVNAMRGRIDHSTAGAQVIKEYLWNTESGGKIAAQILSLAIASHHSGLIDCLTPSGENNYLRRMKKVEDSTHKLEALSNLPEIESFLDHAISHSVTAQIISKIKDIPEDNKDSKETVIFKSGLLIRFLFSCLIDADRLDTADFESPDNLGVRNYGQYIPWKILIERLNHKLNEFESKEQMNEVEILRAEVSRDCLEFAKKQKGIYQLTVPTGGGKTLASLRFALNHAEYHNLDRVFYIIPYTSIIDQNAEEVRKILEERDEKGRFLDRVVLEHHSNLTPEEETNRQHLISQNWDAPIIFTTQVQFLEALFGGGTQAARRMHQLANSVIILDEVQTVPIKCIHMLNLALRFLVHSCGASVVLCTATQPPLDKVESTYRALTISSDKRIIQDESALFEKLKRVNVFDRRKTDGWSDYEVADLVEKQVDEKGNVLIVVNTRRSARSLFETIVHRNLAKTYHLSTNMCPAHRLDVLSKVKACLTSKNPSPVICVSTQLIEAGVDIDFGSVIRYLASIDSIAQAAGRCNRNGIRKDLGSVWIVNPVAEQIKQLRDIKIGQEIAQRVLDDIVDNPTLFGDNLIGLEVMAIYYNYYYYARKDEMRYRVSQDSSIGREDDLFNLLSTNMISTQEYYRITQTEPDIPFKQSFQSASRIFNVIDSPTRGVVVSYGKQGKYLISQLCSMPELGKRFELMKKAQRYSVNMFSQEFEKLASLGAIHEVQAGTGVFYLDNMYYSEDFGWSDVQMNSIELLIH